MRRRRIFAWEITGFVFVSLLGSFLHFVFALLDGWPPAALIAAVNESVWEHLKLAFWPSLIYSLIEWPFFRGQIKDFWTAKTIGIMSMPIVIVSLFYGYTTLAGRNFLWADISLFVLAVLTGQMISYRILTSRPFASRTRILAAILLLAMIAAFSLLTYFPPRHPLFLDPRAGEYGVLK